MIETADEFHLLIDDDPSRVNLIFYAAPWCGPCRLTSPVVKKVMETYAGRLTVREVCTDEMPELCEEEQIEEIPTVILYGGGEVKEKVVGR